MSDELEYSKQEIIESLIIRGWKDPSFKQLLQEDPKAAIELELGFEIPDDVEIKIHSEDEKTIHFVIPYFPEDEQTDDEEMIQVMSAGGGPIRLLTTPQGTALTVCTSC